MARLHKRVVLGEYFWYATLFVLYCVCTSHVSVSIQKCKDFAGGDRFDANQFLCPIMDAPHDQSFCSAFSPILLAPISVASIF